MCEKSISFNGEMNAAVRERRKTVTRLCAKYRDGYKSLPVPRDAKFIGVKDGKFVWELDGIRFVVKPPYQQGDIVYVKETYDELPVRPDGSFCDKGSTYLYYKSDGDLRPRGWRDSWKPSLQMPKAVARTFLKISSVRVEHLKDIFLDPPGPENQIVRSGYRYGCDFIAGWQNGLKKSQWPSYGYDANPWVWVVEFELYWPEER